MTNQVNQAFEDFVKSDYDHNANLKTENYSIVVYKDDEVESMWMAWQAATQARDSEINSLKQRVDALQADNLRLREALEIIRMLPDLECVLYKCDLALSSTPTQSLVERDNEVIYRCANICDEYANSNFGSLVDSGQNGAYVCSKSIRALKVNNE